MSKNVVILNVNYTNTFFQFPKLKHTQKHTHKKGDGLGMVEILFYSTTIIPGYPGQIGTHICRSLFFLRPKTRPALSPHRDTPKPYYIYTLQHRPARTRLTSPLYLQLVLCQMPYDYCTHAETSFPPVTACHVQPTNQRSYKQCVGICTSAGPKAGCKAEVISLRDFISHISGVESDR